jgi:hypothetical protein
MSAGGFTDPARRDRALATRRAKNEARAEDVRWMTETGECLDGAAERLGICVHALEYWLRRHAPDLLPILRERNPRDHNAPGVLRMTKGTAA